MDKSKTFNIRSTLFNSDSVWSTIWSTIQQIVVAASTFFILQAIAKITAQNISSGLMYTALFVASLVLVYIPNTLSMFYLQKWRISSFASYVGAFIELNSGKVSLGHGQNKSKSEAWLTHESFTVYDAATDLLYQIFSTALNSTLNILIIAVALDSRLLAWYALAGAALVAANLIFKGKISAASGAVQETRKDLSNAMLSAWDNIFVGNNYCLQNWCDHFSAKIAKAKRSAAHYDVVRSLISSATVCVALGVVAFGNGIFLYQNQTNIPKMAALLITLPRQLQIIQSIFAFFNLVLSWTGIDSQLKELEKAVRLGEKAEDPRRFIQLDAIAISSGADDLRAESVEGIEEHFHAINHGRWTLRGRNGAGKSTLLGILKERWSEAAFLLPSKFGDLRFRGDFQNQSDGNRLLSVFQEIAGLQEVHTIILDEWDANLDGENQRLIHRAIDELARTKLVIESRHRS